MFKTLISTFLLCSSVFKPNNSIDVKKDVATSSSLYGAYVLRDVFDEDYVNDGSLDYPSSYTIFSWEDVLSTKDYPMVLINDTGNSGFYYRYCVYMTVGYFNNSDYYVEESVPYYHYYLFDLYYIDEYTNDSSNEDGSVFEQINADSSLASLDAVEQDLIIYFPNQITLPLDTYNCFMSLFTGHGNAYNTLYDGYYSIFVPNYYTNWSFVGSCIVNNTMYNYCVYNGNGTYCTFQLNGRALSYTYINGGKLDGNKNVLLSNVMLNNTFRERMLEMGSFSYIYEPVEYTFGEMIFNVIDAPIYMLSQLFSFKLFGIELYVAFTSVFTLLLIALVVRKLI